MTEQSQPDNKDFSDRRRRVARLNRLATSLDAKFTLPGLRIPIGWDSILGLIPGVGDVVTAGPGAAMIYEVRRMGGRKRAMARMGVNTGIDMLVGSIPLVGDLFDVAFKSHRKNAEILKAELGRIEGRETQDNERSETWPSESDPKTEDETATGFSENRVPLINREGQAVHSNATSPRKTK